MIEIDAMTDVMRGVTIDNIVAKSRSVIPESALRAEVRRSATPVSRTQRHPLHFRRENITMIVPVKNIAHLEDRRTLPIRIRHHLEARTRAVHPATVHALLNLLPRARATRVARLLLTLTLSGTTSASPLSHVAALL